MNWSNAKEILVELENNFYEYNQLYYIYLGLINDLDVSKYIAIDFNSYQMEQIYLGLLHNIYVDDYADSSIPANKMKTLRAAIENGTFDPIMLDPLFTATDVYKMSKALNNGIPRINKYNMSKKEDTPLIISDEELDAISLDNLFDEDIDELDFNDFTAPSPVEEEPEYIDDLYAFYENFSFTSNIDLLHDTIIRFPVLSAEEESLIINSFYSGNYDSRDRFLLSNIKLVISIANKYHAKSMEKDDLFQTGFIGLMTAARKFDLSFETKFSTYAVAWIKQTITRAIADYDSSIRLPVHYNEQLKKFNRLSTNEDGEITYEIAKANYSAIGEDITKDEYEQFLYTNCLNDFVELTPELLDEDFGYTHDYYKNSLREELLEILKDNLNEREQQIIEYRFGLIDGTALTLEEVGEKYGLTRERIRQIEAKAMKKISTPAILEQLEIYFKQ